MNKFSNDNTQIMLKTFTCTNICINQKSLIINVATILYCYSWVFEPKPITKQWMQ